MAQTISAALIVTELKALGYSADVDKDESGDPRINTKVDGYAWSIYFYECDDAGALQDRQCGSYQFYSGYTPSKGDAAADHQQMEQGRALRKGVHLSAAEQQKELAH